MLSRPCPLFSISFKCLYLNTIALISSTTTIYYFQPQQFPYKSRPSENRHKSRPSENRLLWRVVTIKKNGHNERQYSFLDGRLLTEQVKKNVYLRNVTIELKTFHHLSYDERVNATTLSTTGSPRTRCVLWPAHLWLVFLWWVGCDEWTCSRSR